MAQESAKAHHNYETYLKDLMEKQWEERLENRKKAQVRQAGFPSKLYLSDLQRDLLPADAKDRLPELERLDFIEKGQNIVIGRAHV